HPIITTVKITATDNCQHYFFVKWGSFQLSVISYQLSAFSFQLLVPLAVCAAFRRKPRGLK
ncbi:MAG: hypothetical protein AB4080_19505, partial [Trichodesmium sp.]